MLRPEVIVAPDPRTLASWAAERFAKITEDAVRLRGRFTVALAGGSTPKEFYSILSGGRYREGIPWHCAHVFWGDERCVPPDHAESNYRMAMETLLRHVSVPEGQIHRARGEDPDPDRAASEYEDEIRATFGRKIGPPRFDLILLGMGADGHVASLFPGSRALREMNRLVVAPYVDRLKAYRLTLTVPIINEARAVFFLVSGGDKAPMLRSALEGTGRSDPIPAQLVWPREGILAWFVDRSATALLGRAGDHPS